MPKTLLRSMNLWGAFHVAVVGMGLLIAAGVSAQDQPASASQGGSVEFKKTVDTMHLAYAALRDNNWNWRSSAFDQYSEALNHHKQAINPGFRDAVLAPQMPEYSQVALICYTYYHPNESMVKGVGECRPTGYYLVMYKNGDLLNVPARDVRLLTTGGADGESIEVFPGMDSYDASLPPLPTYQSPWFKGEGNE